MNAPLSLLRQSAIALVAGLSIASAASAAVVYDTGPSDVANGNEATTWIEANSFVLGANAAVTGAGVYIGTFTADLSNWDGTFDYWFFNDSGSNSPGSIIASGAATVNSITDTGINWFANTVQLFDISFAAVNLLGGTNYWLGIHLASDFSGRDELYWAGVSGQPDHSESFGGTMNNWSTFGPGHAFYLTDGEVSPVPLPSSLSMLGLGLAGAAFVARRRRAA